MRPIKIGVLGGIGPEATGEFYCKLIARLQETGAIKSNIDFPQIFVNSIPAPELIHETISYEELKPYSEGLKTLERFGIDYAVMVCNTIHLYHGALQKEITTPIIDLREEVKKFIIKKKMKSLMIIGTPSTIKRGLYRFEGICSYEPDNAEQMQLSEAVFEFNRGFDKNVQIQKVKRICQKYLDAGAETIILGCTEFAVMLKDAEFPKINTIDVLVNAVVHKFAKMQENPFKESNTA